jgi:hypothetical protein
VALPRSGSQQPFGRSVRGSVWKPFSRRKLAFALCKAWPNRIGIQPGASGPPFPVRPQRVPLSIEPRIGRDNPKQLIEWTESRLRACVSTRQLLAEGKILQRQASASVKHPKVGSETEPKEDEHGGKVIADRILLGTPMSLISKPDGIVAKRQINRHPENPARGSGCHYF